MTQYDKIGDKYTMLSKIDPFKQFSQYPSGLNLLGDVKGKKILEIGCGDGIFTRMVARKGAIVTGYDVSEMQIKKALEEERKNPLGIKYVVSEPAKFETEDIFDKVVSVVALPYALDKKDLENFFKSAFRFLKDGSEFVSVTFNPQFKRFGDILYNRRWAKKNGIIAVEFFDNGKILFTAEFSDLSVEDYEKSAKNSGFSSFCWKPVVIEKKGLKKIGKDFWKGYKEDCPLIGFVSKK